MKNLISIPAALLIGLACVSPALASAPAPVSAIVAAAAVAGEAKAASDTGAAAATTPEAKLQARLKKMKARWAKIKGAPAAGRKVTRAQFAKMKRDLAELKAEAKAGKGMMVKSAKARKDKMLTKLINNAEAELKTMKPVDAK